MTGHRKIRLFLDSNVVMSGIVSQWGLDKAILSLCAAQICKLVLAQVVREEMEENLLLHTSSLAGKEADEIVDQYHRLIELIRPEEISYPSLTLVRKNRSLIRHEADVPVILSAVIAQPDWLLTHNTKHFTKEVARRSGLRIATPAEFFKTLSSIFA